MRAHQRFGLVLAPLLFVTVLLLPPPTGFSSEAWSTAALTVLMAIWWATEALPIAATAMLPLALLPVLGVGSADAVARPYANSTIFLILGGFLIALAMERWDLHRRIAYNIVARAGTHPHGMIFGFMLATAFISMWVSNTSTTLMMLPVALSVVAVVEPAGEEEISPATAHFRTALLLSVGYSASIGGLATLVGTPTNAIAAAFMREQYGIDIGFAEWLWFGLPTVAVLLPAAWLLLVRVAFPFKLANAESSADVVRSALASLGRLRKAEKRVALVFMSVALAWVLRPWLTHLPGLSGLNDMSIAILGGLALFVIPSGEGTKLLGARELRSVPWDVLLLFGGGLSLAAAIDGSGLSARIGELLSVFGSWPLFGLVLVVVALVIFWTELTSNVATVSTFLPILAAIASATVYPPLLLIIPAAMAGTCAFMLPVATPPNAIVYGTGRVEMLDMIRAGLWLNAAGIVILTLAGWKALPWLLSGHAAWR